MNARALVAEGVGSAFLLATVVGSGIMAERLAGGNVAIALLGNTLATGCMLVVLILVFGPISGAHFNPAVSLVFALKRELPRTMFVLYAIAQVIGAVVGVLVAHMMFEHQVFELSARVRDGAAQWLSESVATFGLVATILGTLSARATAVPLAVGLYISAAYWFTASTSFANPAVTIARSLSDTFAGVQPSNVPAFVVAQVIGAVGALILFRWLVTSGEPARVE